MTFAIEIEKIHVQKSERVKSLDLHPTEPWILVSLYTGTVQIWNYQSQTVEKSYQVSQLSPVRSAKFIAREKCIVAGADDHFIRVYNYTTEEKTKEFKAHDDFIRSLAVHPTLPYVLSCSDDKTIKLWDWEKDWACTKVFNGHNHYVMQVIFNPKDNLTFTSVSLDYTVKMWNLNSADPILELEAHSKGVNCVDFLSGVDKHYLITGSDDHTAKVWDFKTQSCVQTLEGHKNNVSALAVHPELPALFTGSEDGTFSVWDATNYRLLNTQSSELGRVWAIGFVRLEGSRMLILGCDEGMVMAKIVCSESGKQVDHQAVGKLEKKL